jgi:predicted RNA-binding protein YlqC (UPF0109 family)
MTETIPVESQSTLASSMITLISNMARALVDQPERVSVHAVQEAGGTMLLLRVASADLGKVIGKQGRTARSMRTILGAASMKAQHRFSLDIQSEEGWQKPTSVIPN